MPQNASDLARSLARNAEAVCRYYLANGRREGRYWLVGDARNSPGRSLFVRLIGADFGRGAKGHWTDAATGEHGDLLDIIRETCGFSAFGDIADEARRFLNLPLAETTDLEPSTRSRGLTAPTESSEAAQRLFAASRPIAGTISEAYLRHRGILSMRGLESLRFHPRCFYRPHVGAPTESWPAMIGAVTDLNGNITGVHRTWLDPSGRYKAPIEAPRRAMGHLLGNAVRFGQAHDVLAAGEGIETMLSLRCVLPEMPMAAALSAAHLAAILFPPNLRRLYIVRDADPAGEKATLNLSSRSADSGIEVIVLTPRLGDFNEDLVTLGLDELQAAVRVQVAPEDVARFMGSGHR